MQVRAYLEPASAIRVRWGWVAAPNTELRFGFGGGGSSTESWPVSETCNLYNKLIVRSHGHSGSTDNVSAVNSLSMVALNLYPRTNSKAKSQKTKAPLSHDASFFSALHTNTFL